MTRMRVASGTWRVGLAAMFVVALALGLLAAPLAAHAQQPGRVYRIDWLSVSTSGYDTNPKNRRIQWESFLAGRCVGGAFLQPVLAFRVCTHHT